MREEGQKGSPVRSSATLLNSAWRCATARAEGVRQRLAPVPCCPAPHFPRLREMREQAIGSVRYVAVSATIPNVRDLAEWLGAPPAGIKCFGGCWQDGAAGCVSAICACAACGRICSVGPSG